MGVIQDYKVVVVVGGVDVELITFGESEDEAIEQAVKEFAQLARAHGKAWPVEDDEPDGEDTSDQEPYPGEQADDERYPGRGGY